MVRLRHSRIINLLDTFSDKVNIYIVTEYCGGGELWSVCANVGEPEYRAKVYFKQILEGLSYMHRMGIVHRDLKAENIFLTTDRQNIKLGDLGTSRDMFNPHIAGAGNSSSSGSTLRHYVGTPHFLSPEAIENKENDYLSDIWSLGCLFYQVLVGLPPFVAGSEFLIYVRIRHGDLQFPKSGLSKLAIDLIRWIVVPDRLKRPSIDSIGMHAFFTDCPQRVPPYNLTDTCIRSGGYKLLELSCISESARGRIQLVKTVDEWKKISRIGTAILDHLNAPELHIS
jgi:serine/threonine protein kinase